jgi:hypothetical protein
MAQGEGRGGPYRSAEEFCHLRCDFFGRGDRPEPFNDSALAVDQELLEVPGDVGPAGLAAQPLVELAGPVAVDLDLVKERERDVVRAGREFEDLGIRSRLLTGELVAWKAEDAEALVLEVLMKRTQTCVLRGEASSAGDVDDQQHLAAVVAERDVVAGDRLHRQVVQL